MPQAEMKVEIMLDSRRPDVMTLPMNPAKRGQAEFVLIAPKDGTGLYWEPPPHLFVYGRLAFFSSMMSSCSSLMAA